MHTTYIALGTNLGDRAANLREALAALPRELTVLAQSPIYETPAWGYQDQPAFLNMVIKAETGLPAETLLVHLKQIEADLGRTPSFHWGPRLIDIDILLFDDLVVSSPTLTVPHPRLHQRAFVLVPLNDLAPQAMHPVLGETVSELLSEISTSGIKRWSPEH